MKKETGASATPPDRQAAGCAETAATTSPRADQAASFLFSLARVTVFAAFFAWFLYEIVEIRLLFPARNTLFLWNWRFFTDYLGQPGSLLTWADGLLIQLSYAGWPCAVAMAMALWIVLISTIAFMDRLGKTRTVGTWLVPAIILVALYSQLVYHTSVLVGLALAIAAANGWIRMPLRQPILRWVLFLLVSAVLFYVTRRAYYCFAACCIIYEALAERRWILGGLLLLTAVGVALGLPVVLAHVHLATDNFRVPYLDEYENKASDWRVGLLYAYFPVCALVVLYRHALGRWLISPWQHSRLLQGKKDPVGNKKVGNSKGAAPSSGFAFRGVSAWLRWTFGTVLTLAVAAAVGVYHLNKELAQSLEIDGCSEHQQWDELLRKAKDLPETAYAPNVSLDVNAALYHTGRLPYEMFSYPQVFPPIFVPQIVSSQQPRQQSFRQGCDLLMELGRANEAEHLALELQEKWPTGGSLKRLATVKMVKGQIAMATVLLRVLCDDLVWSGWAEDYLRCLAADPTLSEDKAIQEMRKRMPSKDDTALVKIPHTDGGTEPAILLLLNNSLECNHQNQMAFEYLMATYLFAVNLDGFAANLPKMDAFPYSAIPTHYEEAILLYARNHPEFVVSNSSGVLCRGRKISNQTVNRYRRLLEILNRYGVASEQARGCIASEMKGSYFYYCLYGQRKKP